MLLARRRGREDSSYDFFPLGVHLFLLLCSASPAPSPPSLPSETPISSLCLSPLFLSFPRYFRFPSFTHLYCRSLSLFPRARSRCRFPLHSLAFLYFVSLSLSLRAFLPFPNILFPSSFCRDVTCKREAHNCFLCFSSFIHLFDCFPPYRNDRCA